MKFVKDNIRNSLIDLARGDIGFSFYDLDTILQRICKLGNDIIKYDVIIHRFFEEDIGHMGMPNGWFCHIVTWEYNNNKNKWFKNRDKSIKVFGCSTPKTAVVECLKIMFSDDI